MKDIVLIIIHLAVTAAKLLGPGGVRAIVAENLLLKQQLIVLRRPRRRAPNLTVWDRYLLGFGSLFLSPGRIRKVAIGLQPSTLLKFHEALVRRKYHRLFASSHRPKKPGPKGPSDALRAQIPQPAFRLSSYCLDYRTHLRRRHRQERGATRPVEALSPTAARIRAIMAVVYRARQGQLVERRSLSMRGRCSSELLGAGRYGSVLRQEVACLSCSPRNREGTTCSAR
jgi:hypothetical protein